MHLSQKILMTLILLFQFVASAAVISPSSKEVNVEFSSEFITANPDGLSTDELIQQHYQHFFGYFHSPSLVRKFGLNSNLLEGVGAPKMPMTATVLSKKKTTDGLWIRYKAKGQMLLNKVAANSVLKAGSWTVTLPANLDNYYDQKCTDTHYDSFGDFWYFYNPFQKDCQYLAKPPMANEVVLKITENKEKVREESPRLDLLRGNNGNGNLFHIVTINGFAESATARGDDGRVSFKEMNRWLVQQGFTEETVAHFQNRPIMQYEKNVTSSNGKSVTIRLTRLLADTAIESKNVTFAKFFKSAVESADVVLYQGHSGLGGNLDIPSLEEKAGKFVFNQNKRQIFFFDGCSSYSYYLQPFAEQKSKSKLDVMVNGLSSLFATEFIQTSKFFEILFDLDRNPSWQEILNEMEKTLDGATYMLSVGSV